VVIILFFLVIAVLAHSLMTGGRVNEQQEIIVELCNRILYYDAHAILAPEGLPAGLYELYTKEGEHAMTFVVPDPWLQANWKEFYALTKKIIDRAKEDYSLDYIESCGETDPTSLVSLVRKMETAKNEELIPLAQKIINKVLSVYKPEVIEKDSKEKPDSLIGVVKKLEALLATRKPLKT
jgi:hypothetical protein